jgi:transposase
VNGSWDCTRLATAKVQLRLASKQAAILKPSWSGSISTIHTAPPPSFIAAPAVLSEQVEEALDTVIGSSLKRAATPPQHREASPLPRWTLKRLVTWVKQHFNIDCCRDTVRKILKALGFSWKKARKLLNKADPHKRAAFVEKLKGLIEDARHNRHLLVYIDEAHIHLDTDEGYGWSIKGERFWVSSSSPGLAKVSFYGLYLLNLGQVRIFPYDCANQLNTLDVLQKLASEFPETPITLIWDGAPYHRAGLVQEIAQILDIKLEPLPGYSPDFMPVEHLWQWLREDLTYHICYDDPADLINHVEQFERRINADPIAVVQRLQVTTHLKPEEEKLRVSS